MNKVLFLIFGIFLIGLIDSCCNPNTYRTALVGIKFEPMDSFIPLEEHLEFRLLPVDTILYMADNRGGGLFQSAVAYSCDESDTFDPVETVRDIAIYCKSNYSNEIPANSEMGGLITVVFFNWRTQKIEEFMLEKFIAFMNSDTRRTGRIAEFANATYKLTQRPTNKKQTFRLEFKLTDNSVLTTETMELEWE